LQGASGAGKSSFVQAGVVPYLEAYAGGYRALRDRTLEDTPVAEDDHLVLSVRASADLLGQLAEALCQFCAQPYVYTTPLGKSVTVDLPAIVRGAVQMPIGVSASAIQEMSVAERISAVSAAGAPAAGDAPDEEVKPADLWRRLDADPGLLALLATQ